jgi:hypothetical protein
VIQIEKSAREASQKNEADFSIITLAYWHKRWVPVIPAKRAALAASAEPGSRRGVPAGLKYCVLRTSFSWIPHRGSTFGLAGAG